MLLRVIFIYPCRLIQRIQPKIMKVNWAPKVDQKAFIARTIEFIFDELTELQEYLGCPNFFIIEIGNKVISPYQSKKDYYKGEE